MGRRQNSKNILNHNNYKWIYFLGANFEHTCSANFDYILKKAFLHFIFQNILESIGRLHIEEYVCT